MTINLIPGKMWPKKGEYWKTSQSVHIRCFDCGKFFTLDDHTIDKDGNVTPSVVCPTGNPERKKVYPDEKKCNWHVWLKLLNWKE